MKILALDQGTTSSRSILFGADGTVLAKDQREFEQIFPEPAWVEHDPHAIWRTQLATIQSACAAGPPDAIGITNQRETTVLWERASGKAIANAIVWQDRRTADICARLKADGAESMVRERTGLVLDPYFSGTKIAWLLDHVPGARARAEAGELAFGTIDSWLVWNLTGGASTGGAAHLTDASNASRTMLLNIHTGAWDDDLLELLRVPRAILPEVVASSGVVAEATVEGLEGVPIAGIAGDQQAALFGQACIAPGMAKNTYGTGCFLLMNTGTEPVLSNNGLLSTVAWRLGDTLYYALEGSVFIGGAVVQWLRDGLGLIESSAQVEQLAAEVEDTGGVVLVPAFTGLGAPHWQPNARGSLSGITRGTTRAHIARAALEAIAFQSAELLDCMRADADLPLRELRVDGGACANNLLMQIQADVLDAEVVRPQVIETTALGAAALAGLGIGQWDKIEDFAAGWREDRRFQPQTSDQTRAARARWDAAVAKVADVEGP